MSLNCLKKFLYQIDIFKIPFLLSFKNRKQSSTCLGSFFSLSILALVIYLFINSDMVLKINPQVIDQITTNDHAPSIELNHHNFEIAAGVADSFGIGFSDPTIFKIKFIHVHIDLFASDKSNKTKVIEIFQVNDCSEKSFSEPNTFSELVLANYTCIKNEGFELEGGFEEKFVQSVVVMISYCNNKTDGVVCKSQTEIENFFTDKGLWLYYQDDIYDVSNYENPVKKNWRVQAIQCAAVPRIIDLYLKKLIFITDNGFLFSNEQIIYGFMKERSEGLSHYVMVDSPLITINLFSSKNIQKTQRQYQKFGELLASIGGVINVLVIAGFFITNLQNEFQMQNHIMNSLYYGSFEQEAKKPKIKKGMRLKKKKSDRNLYNWNENCEEGIHHHIKKPDLNENEIFSLKMLDNPFKNKTKSNFNKSDNLKTQYGPPNERKITINLQSKNLEKMKSKIKDEENKPISLKFLEYFKMRWKLFWKMKMKNKEKLFLLSEKRLRQESDIVHILEKIHQFEKLKRIMLNPKQLELFEFLAKPLIILNSQKKLIQKKSIYMLSENFIMNSQGKPDVKKRKEQMQIYYKELSNNGNLSKIDKSMLRLIEEDISIIE